MRYLIKYIVYFVINQSQIPAAEYQNGPLKDVIIFYLCQRGLYEISGNLTVSNVTARSTTIPGLQSSDRCHVWMKTCNGPQFCSAISNKCTPQSVKGTLPGINSVLYRPNSQEFVRLGAVQHSAQRQADKKKNVVLQAKITCCVKITRHHLLGGVLCFSCLTVLAERGTCFKTLASVILCGVD